MNIKVFNFGYIIQIITRTIFNINFLKFIITFHFYNTFINMKLLLIRDLCREMVISVFVLFNTLPDNGKY